MMTYLSGGTDKIDREDLGKAVRSAFPEKGGTLMATIAEQWFQEGEAKGEAKGEARGILIGKILLAQQIQRQKIYSEADLEEKSIGELQIIFSDIVSSISV